MKKPATIKLTMQQLVDWFAESIWFHASRKAIGIWTPEDVFQEVVMSLSEREWQHKPTLCRHSREVRPIDPSHVIHAIEMKIIDLFRKETRRRVRVEISTRIIGHDLNEMNVAAALKAVAPMLQGVEHRILVELAEPSAVTRELAKADQDAAKARAARGDLAMNVSGAPKVTRTHVARALGVPVRAVSNALEVARAAFEDEGLLVD